MKRYISVLLALCLLFGVVALTACQPSGDREHVSGESESETETTGNDPQIELNIIDDNYRNWYEIFVYSFYDSDNDGIGDLNGVTKKLDYIKDLGFNGIWLMPIHPSPTYHKYDVKDYYAVDPAYGTLDDLKTLIDEAHKRDIHVILDLVINHSAAAHPWFAEACDYIRENGAPGGKYGDYYNFSEQNLGGYSAVSGTSYYYESRFWSGMPDLNLDSEAVRAEIVNIMTYWMKDYGVDGFRLDAVTSYYTGNVPKNVAFLNWLNTEAKAINPDCYLVGEAWEGTDFQINRYYESGVDSFFLFTGAMGEGQIASVVRFQNGKMLGKWFETLQSTYQKGIPAPFLGNHDNMRPGSFMADEESLKMAAGILSMMNGSTFVYYGEEIGMISKGGANSDPAKRIAMKWEQKFIHEGYCVTSPEGTPVDAGSYYYPSVAEQMADESSILNYYKQAMTLRNRFPSIARGTVENLPVEDNSYLCVLRKTYRDETITIVFNLDAFEQTLSISQSLLGSGQMVGELYAASEGTASVSADGTITLPPYSIVIFK